MSSLLPLWQTTLHRLAMQVAESSAPRFACAHEKVRCYSRRADGTSAGSPAQVSLWVQRDYCLASVFSAAAAVYCRMFPGGFGDA